MALLSATFASAVTESEARAELNNVNAQLDAATAQYQDLVAAVDNTDARIAAVEAKIAALNAEYVKTTQALDIRYRAIYKYGAVSMFELILGSRDLNDLTQRLALLTRLADGDIRLMQEEASHQADLNKLVAQLEQEKSGRQAQLTDVGGARQDIINQLKQKEEALSGAQAADEAAKNTPQEPAQPAPPAGGTLTGHSESGEASYYNFTGGYTAAHRTLPLGTMVRVTNLANGAQVWVEIVDRGPWGAGRVIDLEETAFARIADISAGVIQVAIEW